MATEPRQNVLSSTDSIVLSARERERTIGGPFPTAPSRKGDASHLSRAAIPAFRHARGGAGGNDNRAAPECDGMKLNEHRGFAGSSVFFHPVFSASPDCRRPSTARACFEAQLK